LYVAVTAYVPAVGNRPTQAAVAVPLAAVTPTGGQRFVAATGKVPFVPAYWKVTVPVGLSEPAVGAGVGVTVAEYVTGVLSGAELEATEATVETIVVVVAAGFTVWVRFPVDGPKFESPL
jgi:hypothetical protein